jgi:predicted dehydrogenase
MTDVVRLYSDLPSRRDFLKTSSAAALAGAVGSTLAIGRSAHAAGSDLLKVGLIGCGGRGSSAASQALRADPNVKLVAVGDMFADHVEGKLRGLMTDEAIQDRIDVPPERRFLGFDAYKEVIACSDIIILATPPHFRPMHLRAAIDANKHVFCEKPVAVDAPGVRSVLESVELARQKNLSLVSGLCWRYHRGMMETFQRLLDGQIGDIVAIHEQYNTNGLWMNPRKPQWTDMEWQLRNWLYFTWLSGDHNVEQHVHSLDKGAWAMRDVPPVRATGLGGRQVRTSPDYGHIFDHHAVVYEYASGTKMFAFCRQQNDCDHSVTDHFFGTKGRCDIDPPRRFEITGDKPWVYEGPQSNMYQVEHDEWLASIRSGQPINNGIYMTWSTMIAIMGRMATYTGKTITWEQALNSQEDLSPPRYEMGPLAMPKVALPGVTPFV